MLLHPVRKDCYTGIAHGFPCAMHQSASLCKDLCTDLDQTNQASLSSTHLVCKDMASIIFFRFGCRSVVLYFNGLDLIFNAFAYHLEAEKPLIEEIQSSLEFVAQSQKYNGAIPKKVGMACYMISCCAIIWLSMQWADRGPRLHYPFLQ